MEPEQIPTIFAIGSILALLLIPTTIFLSISWIQELRRAHRAERLLEQSPTDILHARDLENATHQRLLHLEHRLERLAGEAERLGDGQRFAARLLATRAEGSVDAAAPARVTGADSRDGSPKPGRP